LQQLGGLDTPVELDCAFVMVDEGVVPEAAELPEVLSVAE
jgi:hypothetical protein